MISSNLEWDLNEILEAAGWAAKVEGKLQPLDALQVFHSSPRWMVEINPVFQGGDQPDHWDIQASSTMSEEESLYRGEKIEDWQGFGEYVEPGYPTWHSNQPTRIQALIMVYLHGYTKPGCSTTDR